MSDVPDHIQANQAVWDAWADGAAADGDAAWASDEPYWGIWSIPEAQVGFLPPQLDGLDAVELGCGTAYVCAWLARRGARPVGVDLSAAQLGHARRLQAQHGLRFPLIQASAEQVPLPGACADFVVSEYGASLWAEPQGWLAEAARLLRPGGRLTFLVHSWMLALCLSPDPHGKAGDRLVRSGFGGHRLTWPGEGGIEFHLSHASWIAAFRHHGFEVDALLELRPPEGAATRYGFVDLDWARRWPCEEVWKLRKKG